MRKGLVIAFPLALLGSAWLASAAFGEEVAPGAPAGRIVEPAPAPGTAEVAPEIVATVNGKPLTRDQLAALAIRLYGRQTLEMLISHEVIRQEAAKQGITLSQEEIEAYLQKSVQDQLDELARSGGAKDFADWGAKRGNTPAALENLRKGRAAQLRPFAGPELLARKLLAREIEITDADLRAEFERRYGPKAKVLQIVLRSRADAEEAIRKLKQGADFGQLARDQSEDAVSRRAGGEIPPLPRGSALGDAAFNLKRGEVSGAVEIADRFHIVKLLEILPAADVRFEDVKETLREGLRDRRMLEHREKWLGDLVAKSDVRKEL